MKFLIVFFMLFAADAVAQHPGGCADVPPPTFSGRLVRAGDAVPVRKVERHARQAERQARRVTYAPHVTYSPHVNYRAGEILYVPRVTRLPRFNAPLRPQAYFYSDLLNYQGSFSYGY